MGSFFLLQIKLLVCLLLTFAVFTALSKFKKSSKLPVIFKHAKKESLLALIPVTLILLLTVFIFLIAKKNHSDLPISEIRFTDVRRQWISNILILLPFVILMFFRKQGFSTFYLTAHNFTLSMAGSGIVILIIAVIYNDMSVEFWFSQKTLFIFLSQLGVGISEEIIFRGILLTRFTCWLGAIKGIMVTAVIFALLHIPKLLSESSTILNFFLSLAVLFIFGLLFNMSAKKMENISGLMIVHALLNVVEIHTSFP